MLLGVKQELMLDLQNLKVKCQAYDKFEVQIERIKSENQTRFREVDLNFNEFKNITEFTQKDSAK
mgnify:CR=1 FL=1